MGQIQNRVPEEYRQAYPFLSDNSQDLHWGTSTNDDFLTVFNDTVESIDTDDLDNPEIYDDTYFEQFYKEDYTEFQKRQERL